MPVPTLACVVASWAAGCEAQGKSLSGSCAIRGSRARGSAGWVNIGEPSLMRRHDDPREMDVGPGYRAWPALIETDRIRPAGPTDGVDLWWSGKHANHGGNVQVITAPDGWPLWTSEVRPGREHDTTALREPPEILPAP